MELSAGIGIRGRILKRSLLPLVAALTITAAHVSDAYAQGNEATRILKMMSDFVASQKVISVTFDADIEVITPDVQKIQFTNSGTTLLSRPDKLRASRAGGYSAVDFVFDGKTLTTLSRDHNVFAQIQAPGSVDQLITKLRTEYSVTAPGADLLLSNVFDDLMENVIEAKHIGVGVIDGVECAHLAFRTSEVDWQIWVELGARPIPRKYVITSKSVTAAPQYTLRIKEWRTDVPLTADSFAFKPPQGATEVSAGKFPRVDELPEGIVVGGLK